jgi:hypothetical protein
LPWLNPLNLQAEYTPFPVEKQKTKVRKNIELLRLTKQGATVALFATVPCPRDSSTAANSAAVAPSFPDDGQPD